MKKYTTKDIIKNLQKATRKNDFKPQLEGIYSNTDTKDYTCTDSYRLHCYGALNINKMLPTGTYNFETMQIIEENYPDIKQLLKSKDPLTDTIITCNNIIELKSIFINAYSESMKHASGKMKGEYIELYKYNNVLFEINYIDEAIEFLNSIMQVHNVNNQVTVRLTSNRMLHMYITNQSECYAMIMGKNE